jgi:hypothetical protein
MKKIVFLLSCWAFWMSVTASADPKDFSGLLYRQGSQKTALLFTLKAERQPELWADHYFDASGAAAVTERVFLKGGQPTRYEFDDQQQKGLGSVDVEGAKLKLAWTQAGSTKERTVDAPADLIFGPLYPSLLQRRFTDLLAGQAVLATVPVLSQDHLMTARLSFQRQKALEKGDGKVCISMKPANWFVALFFPPIDLYFDGKSAQLMDVHGTSLLKEKKDGAWKLAKVDLYYQY